MSVHRGVDLILLNGSPVGWLEWMEYCRETQVVPERGSALWRGRI
jgi:hypothetical protein